MSTKMKLLLASGNEHKRIEIATILESATIALPSELGVDFKYEETGATYRDNALGKAMTLHLATGKPVLADDSGLSVEALSGAPGVRTARFGAEDAVPPRNDRERYELLLEKLTGIEDRGAAFVCCLALVTGPKSFVIAQENCSGEIARSAIGDRGFGYDPIFYLPSMDRTMAQLSPDIKNRISHRGRALRRIAPLIANLDLFETSEAP